ncbi:hypothetical protein BUALT_Bualt18G0002700 [Buddleja alternifolia]|uniref:Transmembrane protein n=1 Tax=Buddleja alternifolia TaxID=168488 RepID=A0AAV6W749_9LAMI|nr:hypothetical protein BUALT_Bualt18G0002700 [Buddleja alternifolia]
MACFKYLFQCSKSWIALLVPILALFARFSPSLLISITLSLLLILFSTLFLFTISKQKDNVILKEAENEFPAQEKTLLNSHDKVEEDASDQKGFLMGSQDLYSESESMERFSSEDEEDHSSDTEWPYNNMERQTLDYSDDSISDEESLIEIAIPSGQFVKDFNLKCCKLSADFSHQQSIFQKKHSAVDFLAGINEMNEEDNLIEIDIYMGSIKCSSFEM